MMKWRLVLLTAGFTVLWGFDMNSLSNTVFWKRNSENDLFCSLLSKNPCFYISNRTIHMQKIRSINIILIWSWKTFSENKKINTYILPAVVWV